MSIATNISTRAAALLALLVAGSATAEASFSAYATDGKGAWGYATEAETKKDAEKDAIEHCGGPGCKVVLSTEDACTAFAGTEVGGFRYGVASGMEIASVDRKAVENCKHETCTLQRIECNWE